MEIINELQDLRYLEWTRTRHSSGTAGSFLKSYETKGKKKYYYKLSNYDSINGIIGHECINEIVIDRLLSKLNIPHLEYTLIHSLVSVRGVEYETYLCQSVDFKQKGEKKIALDAFYDMESFPGESPMDFCKRFGFEKTIYQMLLIDYLILNRDRHGANIEVLKDGKDRSIRLAPLFDHGLSLVFQCMNDEALTNIDILEDKRIQCFVGSSSAYNNLSLIPPKECLVLPSFDKEMYDFLFHGLEEVKSDLWISTIWKFLKMRAHEYENFCNKRS